MKRNIIVIAFLMMFVTLEMFAQTKQKRVLIKVTNNSEINRKDNPVVIELRDLPKMFKVKSVKVFQGEMEIPSQLDDMDKDARFDEIAFVADIPAESTVEFEVLLSDKQSANTYKARTFAEMMAYNKKGKMAYITGLSARGDENVYSFTHHHGPAFESELVAYRVYFNEKQTVDPYGKYNKGLEIERSKFYPTDQQLKEGFGNDVLRVYNSCGVGALKGWNGSAAIHVTPVVEREERVISSGPVRAIVEAKVIGWSYQGQELNMINRYTIYAGHRDIVIDAIFDEPLKNTTFASGVQKLKENSSMFSDHEGLLGSWGTDYPQNDTVKYAKETVGIGTFIPKRICGKEAADKENYLYVISAPGENSFRYYTTFTSKKETFGYKNDKEWYNYLVEWRKNLENPCTVKISSIK